jgi:Fe-Mn family superoxide dismutase
MRKPANLPHVNSEYPVREFDLSRVQGISREALEDHLHLYQGYVENTNKLLEVALAAKANPGKQPDPEGWVHRLGFEFNGIMLHELFFEQLRGPGGDLPAGGLLAEAADASFGGVQGWRDHVIAVARTRGPGWVLSAREWTSNRLLNFWIEQHEVGIPASLEPVFVLDLWEHAYLRDFGVKGREQWVETVLGNIDWKVVESRCE